MQEETNEKTIALYIKTGKLTAQQLQKAMKALLAQMKKQHDKQKIPHGKQTLKQLMKAYHHQRGHVSARSLFPILFYANGFRPPYFPLISCCMQSFSRPRIKSVVPSAELLLRPPLTASNTARTAGSVLPADRQRSA